MELKKLTIGGNTYTFVNESGDTRHGFKHVSTLFKNNREVSKNTAYYLNRTWECYRYQSAMKGAVYTLIDSKLNAYIDNYKYSNEITRFKKGEKDKVIAEFKQSDTYKELQALKDAVELGSFE